MDKITKLGIEKLIETSGSHEEKKEVVEYLRGILNTTTTPVYKAECRDWIIYNIVDLSLQLGDVDTANEYLKRGDIGIFRYYSRLRILDATNKHTQDSVLDLCMTILNIGMLFCHENKDHLLYKNIRNITKHAMDRLRGAL